MSQVILDELQRIFPHYIIDTHSHCGDDTAIIKRSGLVPITEFLRDHLGFDMLMDITGNDYPEREERFEVVYHFLATTRRKNTRWKRVRLKVRVQEGDSIASLHKHYKVANWYERETWDMFGIAFDGHPDLKRLLTHWQFVGHPLRKDYDKHDRQPLQEPSPLDFFKVRPHQREDGSETQVVNIGPSHPITHNMFRQVAGRDGENLVDGELEIGYLHRCFEKEAEAHTWGLALPFADRLNFVSSPMNAIGYSMAVEKLAGIEVPERCKWLRMCLAEIGRIMDHSVLLGTSLVDMGALTNFWYFFKIREACYKVLDKFTGSGSQNTCDRIGGYTYDTYEGFEDDVRNIRQVVEQYLGDVEKMIVSNRLFLDRTINVGKLSKEDAISFGVTGPVGRASGVQYDVRKAMPYNFYDLVDFEMVIGTAGDTHDRLMVRFYEIKESLKIIEQALIGLEATRGQAIFAEVEGITLPSQARTYTELEAMVQRLQIIQHGEKIPAGEAYGYTEGANGELGFYVVSDGTGSPHRVHLHPPCFSVLQSYIPTIKGLMLSDCVVVFSSLNIIAGELDR